LLVLIGMVLGGGTRASKFLGAFLLGGILVVAVAEAMLILAGRGYFWTAILVPVVTLVAFGFIAMRLRRPPRRRPYL